MIARKATYLCGALVLAQAGGAGADTTLEERIVVLEERMDGIKSGNTQIDFGGFIKADTMMSKYSDGDLAKGSTGRDFMVPSTIPVGGGGSSEELDFIAKQSRFWLKSETMTSAGAVQGYIEIDFQTTGQGDERISNSYSPRIRHAYLAWGNWLFGQTWSTFFNVSALPETVDFVGAAGTVFERQPQIRYTSGPVMLAFENPSTTLYGGDSNPSEYDDNNVPDIVARYNLTGGWGNVSLSAMGRQLKYEDDVGGTPYDEDEYGYGLSVAGRVMLGAMDDIRFQAHYGNALGRYTTLNAFRSGQIEADGSIELIDQWSGVLALRHHWSDRWRSNFAVSVSEADNPDTVAATTSKTIHSAHANLIWQVAEPLTLGAELIYGSRELENGDDGNLKRVQFTAKYAF
ncbi:DcaP family trimeric outer membrane transporter [Alcanivorax borkumensis]|uniref:DcaP family trimeric outer membrane transporter n=1 Tax=Alcanivorax borkumensis TaxID=59754 RepID=UPI003564D57E